MSDPKGAPAFRAAIVDFTATISIEKAALDRAISGGIKRAGLVAAGRQLRDEIFSKVYYLLSRYFAKGKTLKGEVSSLAYKIAYRVAVDTYRRPGAYAKHRSSADVADATPAAEVEMSIETAEARLQRLASNAIRAGVLKTALRKISATDRATLIEMLERSAPLPRGTAAEIKIANATAQREKRARDRLRAAVRGGDDREM